MNRVMKILAVSSGLFGQRIANNLRSYAPHEWQVTEWRAPNAYPIVIDEPLEFLPKQMGRCDLVLALGEHPGLAELVPDICKATGAAAVIAPIDRNEWLPKGLANQLRGWLKAIGVASAFPKPFCSLTETSYSLRGERVEYQDALISEFARTFGKPRFCVQVKDQVISRVQVERGSPCGCSQFVADGLKGVNLNNAEFEAGMLHHHFPCLASMGIDPSYGDTLMHVSGNLTGDAVTSAIKPYRQTLYFTPR
jgi:thymidylate synthase